MSHRSHSPRFVRPMQPRDRMEPHRVASPLELLTDLCFVVAVAQAASDFHHAAANNHLTAGLMAFAMSFFAIWLAWINFTWFASAYDNDDVPYRLLMILQMLGVLVLAAGIHRISSGDFTLGVSGYIIMRIALVAQWFRAARHDPVHRQTCLKYAWGILFVQACWIAFLLVPKAMTVPVFIFLAILELLVPAFAEQSGRTPWHPHHIAERYGLFFIIVLGETILAATMAVQQTLNEKRADHTALYVVAGGILIVFSVWWLYFSRSAGEVLERSVETDLNRPFAWGFGHFFILGSGAAIGAGLASRVDYWTQQHHVTALTSAAMVTVPVAILLITLWLVHLRYHDSSFRTFGPFFIAATLVLAATFTPVPEVLTGVICAALLAVELKMESRAAKKRTT